MNRETPLILLRAINELKDFDTKGYKRKIPASSYLLIEDPHPDSEFFFSVEEVDLTDLGNIEYRVVMNPYSEKRPGSGEVLAQYNNLVSYYNDWVTLIEEYARIIDRHKAEEDPILSQYTKEEYTNFELLDEDADAQSYSLPVQRFIDAYLGDVIKRLENYKDVEELDENRKDKVAEIIEEAKDLKLNQTLLTKQQVVEAMTKFWAKARKIGLDVLVEVRKEVFKIGIKHFAEQVLTNPDMLMNTIKGLLD